jgi:hypothetical protein
MSNIVIISSSSTFFLLINFTKDDESLKKDFVCPYGRNINLAINFYEELLKDPIMFIFGINGTPSI